MKFIEIFSVLYLINLLLILSINSLNTVVSIFNYKSSANYLYKNLVIDLLLYVIYSESRFITTLVTNKFDL